MVVTGRDRRRAVAFGWACCGLGATVIPTAAVLFLVGLAAATDPDQRVSPFGLNMLLIMVCGTPILAVVGWVLLRVGAAHVRGSRGGSGLRGGTVRPHDPLAAETYTDDVTQRLEGAEFPCEASPALPDPVRMHLAGVPGDAPLTSRHLDFTPW